MFKTDKEFEEHYERKMMEFLAENPKPGDIRTWFTHAAMSDVSSMIHKHDLKTAEEVLWAMNHYYIDLQEKTGYDWDLESASLMNVPRGKGIVPKPW